jgi:small-conductance mechanosensitive channel
MENKVLTFSNIELILFGSLALLLFVFMILLKRFLPFIIKSQAKKTFLKHYLTIFEVSIWLLFIIISIQQFSNSNHLYAWGLFILLMLSSMWLLWFWVKDFVAGALFKMNKDFRENDIIQVDNFEGTIIEMSQRKLKIESDSGEIIYIPYTQLQKMAIIKVHPGEMVLSHAFTIRTAKSDSQDLLQEKIRFEALSLPWSSIKRPPQIEIIHEDKESCVFEVNVYSLEKQYFFKIEQEIRKKFEISE